MIAILHSSHTEPCYLYHCQLAKAIDFATMMMITLAKVIVEAIVAMPVLPEFKDIVQPKKRGVKMGINRYISTSYTMLFRYN
jgi:hypothetical protein